MPHVIIKMHSGRSEEQKAQLTKAIVDDIMAIVKCKEEVISVAIQDVPPSQWAEDVYKPDILDGSVKLYKKPGYNPFK